MAVPSANDPREYVEFRLRGLTRGRRRGRYHRHVPDAPDIRQIDDPPAAEASPLRALLALAEQLSGALDVSQIAGIVATTGVDALGASAGFVAVARQKKLLKG